jgi:probable phosphoglycerate mutase
MVGVIEGLREEMPEGVIAVVSHGDPIKTILAHYGGIPLDFLLRFEVSPASVSIVSVNDFGPRILCINNMDILPRF